jgi:hypothetical protein
MPEPPATPARATAASPLRWIRAAAGTIIVDVKWLLAQKNYIDQHAALTKSQRGNRRAAIRPGGRNARWCDHI